MELLVFFSPSFLIIIINLFIFSYLCFYLILFYFFFYLILFPDYHCAWVDRKLELYTETDGLLLTSNPTGIRDHSSGDVWAFDRCIRSKVYPSILKQGNDLHR